MTRGPPRAPGAARRSPRRPWRAPPRRPASRSRPRPPSGSGDRRRGGRGATAPPPGAAGGGAQAGDEVDQRLEIALRPPGHGKTSLALIERRLLRFFIGRSSKGVEDRMSDREIKVTDKRMFNPDGELREEYRFLEENATAAAAAGQPSETSAEP